MEIKGKLIKKLDLQKGVTKNGNEWKSQTCIIETDSQYNNLVAVKCMGEKIHKMNKLKEGDMVAISCNIYSREYKGKFYNNIEGWAFANQNDDLRDNREEFAANNNQDLPF